MPFGLTNAPASFQALVDDVLREYLDDFVFVYLDDIMIYSKTPEDHCKHKKLVLEALRKHGLFAKAEKCKFDQAEVELLGYLVSRDGVRMDGGKVKTVQEWPEPTAPRDIQVFLGSANFYRRFIRNYSKIAKPLNDLIHQNTDFKFNADAKQAFEELKRRFTSASSLCAWRSIYIEDRCL